MSSPQVPAAMMKCWKVLTLKGTLGILLGTASVGWVFYLSRKPFNPFGLSMFQEAMTLAASLVLLLGLYAFLDGICAFVMGFRLYGAICRWWALVGKGLLSVGLGFVLWLRPHSVVSAFPEWIAAWAILTGLLEILQGIEPNGYPARRRQCLWTGAGAGAFGLLLLLGGFGGKSLLWLVGGYVFLSAIPILVLAFQLRALSHSREVQAAA